MVLKGCKIVNADVSHMLRTNEKMLVVWFSKAAVPALYLSMCPSTVYCGLQHCLASKGWKIIIADESHTLRTSEKPPDARHTEAAVSAVRRSKRAVFLTGTPSLSRPFDLFRQV